MSPNTVKELQNDLRNQQRLVRESNAVLRKINKLHEILSDACACETLDFLDHVFRALFAAIESLERDTEEQTQKLRSLYEEAKKLAEDEERSVNLCFQVSSGFRSLFLPLFSEPVTLALKSWILF